MAYGAIKKKHRSDGHVHSVETGSNKENRSVNIISEREEYAVLVLVSLAEKEYNTEKNR